MRITRIERRPTTFNYTIYDNRVIAFAPKRDFFETPAKFGCDLDLASLDYETALIKHKELRAYCVDGSRLTRNPMHPHVKLALLLSNAVRRSFGHDACLRTGEIGLIVDSESTAEIVRSMRLDRIVSVHESLYDFLRKQGVEVD